MTWSTLLAGELPDADKFLALLTELRPLTARKTADETVNNSATLQNDNDLAWAVEADTVYDLRLLLGMNSGTTPDFRLAWTYPTGLTMFWSTIAKNASAVVAITDGLIETTTATYDGQGARSPIYIDGLVVVGGTPGTLQLQWAQNTANASDTKVLAGSYGTLSKII